MADPDVEYRWVDTGSGPGVVVPIRRRKPNYEKRPWLRAVGRDFTDGRVGSPSSTPTEPLGWVIKPGRNHERT